MSVLLVSSFALPPPRYCVGVHSVSYPIPIPLTPVTNSGDSPTIVNFVRLNWDPVDLKFRQLKIKIEDAGKNFVDEVGLQHAKETHELTQAARFKGPRIPCHIISPAKNRLFFPRPIITTQIEAHLLPTGSSSAGLKSFLLHGLGGSGKTQLAANFAYDHWHDYDIIIWAVADTEQRIAHHFLQAAIALDLPNSGDASTIGINVISWLRDCGLTMLPEHFWDTQG